MKRILSIIALVSITMCFLQAQQNSPWHIIADDIDPNEYYGITCGNGMIGLVSSPEPMKVKDVVLNGYTIIIRGAESPTS